DAELFERADHLAQVAPDLTAEEADVLIEAAKVAIGSDPRTVVVWLRRLDPTHVRVDAWILLARAMTLTGETTAAIELLRSIMADTPASTEARVLLASALRMSGETAE